MTDFEKKLPIYKTAFSPTHDTYVGICGVFKDIMGRYIVEATVAGQPKDRLYIFRVEELTNYCL